LRASSLTPSRESNSERRSGGVLCRVEARADELKVVVCQSSGRPILCATSTTPCRRSPRTGTSSIRLLCASQEPAAESGMGGGIGQWLLFRAADRALSLF
jgi:hypothetical protein